MPWSARGTSSRGSFKPEASTGASRWLSHSTLSNTSWVQIPKRIAAPAPPLSGAKTLRDRSLRSSIICTCIDGDTTAASGVTVRWSWAASKAMPPPRIRSAAAAKSSAQPSNTAARSAEWKIGVTTSSALSKGGPACNSVLSARGIASAARAKPVSAGCTANMRATPRWSALCTAVARCATATRRPAVARPRKTLEMPSWSRAPGSRAGTLCRPDGGRRRGSTHRAIRRTC